MSRSAGQSSPRAATPCMTPGSSAAPSMRRSARRAVQPNLEISLYLVLSGRSRSFSLSLDSLSLPPLRARGSSVFPVNPF